MSKVYRPAEIESLLQGIVGVVFSAEDKGLPMTLELDLTLGIERDSQGHLGLVVEADAPIGSVPAKAQAGAGRQSQREADHDMRLVMRIRTTAEESSQ